MEVRHREATIQIVTNPRKSAKSVGLCYVSDNSPGIRRVARRKGFGFVAPNGKVIQGKKTIRRIKSLAIPPAWTDVWICPNERGHLQAVGRDARGRKQYRYHPHWREVRDETKFTRMIVFGKALAKIRRRVEKDLSLPGLPRLKVLATVIRLLDCCHVRVGNDEYARENKSFGLTTLRDHHAKVNGSRVRFQFNGKGTKEHVIEVEDPQLAKIVKRCQELRGQELFQYLDENQKVQDIKSEDVNDYLREASGQDFSAKDFRTWAGTVLAARELCATVPGKTQRQIKKATASAVQIVASKLGNTPAICRKCYVHPAVFESFERGMITQMMSGDPNRKAKLVPKNRLSSVEECVLDILKKYLADRHEPLQSKLRRSLSVGKSCLRNRNLQGATR